MAKNRGKKTPNTFNPSIKRSWVLVLLLCITNGFFSFVGGQTLNPQPFYQQFTVDEGLPSNEVYHVIQDSLGYIWLATANGVSQFDGNNFRNWSGEDGVLEANIHELFIDYQGRIWFISGTGNLAYFQNGTVKSYPYNHKIKENIKSSRGSLKNSFYVDSTDNVHISHKVYGRAQISPEGIFKLFDGIHQESVIVVEKMKEGPVLISNPPKPNDFDVLIIEGDSVTRVYNKDLFPNSPVHFHFFFISESEDTYIMVAWGQLFRIKNGKIIQRKKISAEVIWVGFDKDKKLWVAPIDGGVYCFEDADFSKEPSLYLFNESKITSVTQDRENGYWFSTLSEGVYYCPNINILNLNESNGLLNNKINAVFANKQGISVGYEQGAISIIQKGRIKNYTISDKTSVSNPIRFLGVDSTSYKTWINSSNYVHLLENESIKTFHSLAPGFGGSYPRQMIHAQGGGYWIASSWGIKKLVETEFVFDSRLSKEFIAIVYTVFEDSEGTLWFSSLNGTWNYSNDAFIYLGDVDQNFTYPANHIVGLPDGKILFGTKGVGLLILENNSFRQITQGDGLAGNTIKKIVVHKSGVWLATNSGISWIKNLSSNQPEIQNINLSHGLPTNDINDIFIRGDDVYIASNKGLSFLKIHLATPNLIKPNCSIQDIRINNIDVSTNNKHLTLSHKQNLIVVNFIGLAYKNMGKVKYRYRMNGLDSNWVYTRNNSSIFSRIPPGTYTFEVQAQNSDGIWSNSTRLGFTIKHPFWQTLWFILFSTLLFTAAIFGVFRVRINAVKHRNDLINSANIYKQQSLRQQMNPHFIFNTLNSIQLYILEKDSISSHKYLTKFARLMRITLDNSQQSAIPLRNELEALNLYLELESLRLEGKFTYHIEIENSDILEKQVPTLLIQPFVENAIWHGIMLKEEQGGFVKVNLHTDGNSIICDIEDNGVGRAKAQMIKEQKSSEHKSLGFKITAQRIELLNTLFKDKFDIKYFDLTDPNGEAIGTRVQIRIPFAIQSEEFKN